MRLLRKLCISCARRRASVSLTFNNDQCTVHSIVYYFKKGKEVEHHSILILSDCLSHDTTAVYISQKIIM